MREDDPRLSEAIIEVLSNGRIAYLLKMPRKGRTHLIMTPMEFMARLSARIPRPRLPLVRYHGVLRGPLRVEQRPAAVSRRLAWAGRLRQKRRRR